MDAPRCKLCVDRHYGLCSDVKPAFMEKFRQRDAIIKVATNKDDTASNIIYGTYKADIDEIVPNNKKQRWDRAAYNAYQRDYMRRKRGGQ